MTLILLLVYWIVGRRATRWLAITATLLTASLPLISAGVRSSSLEFLSGWTNYTENWYLDDLRPDIFAIALILWSVAILAEHVDEPRRSSYAVSAVFAAAAVLVKPSTSPLLILVWGVTLAGIWLWNRRRDRVTMDTLLGVGLFAVLLLPWATLGGGLMNTISYLQETAVTYHTVYGASNSVFERFAYFAVRFPTDLGPVEGWAVIAGALFVSIALARRRLARAERIYGAVALLFYLTFALATATNTHYAVWITAATWIYVWAGMARLVSTARIARSPRFGRATLGFVGAYTLVVYGLGAFALANWPADEQRSHAQRLSVTVSLADELSRHISSNDCIPYPPGPGWPGSLQFLLMDRKGHAPGSPPLNPALTVAEYLQMVQQCGAIIVYREDIAQVAQVFYAPPAYQPYLRATADWIHSKNTGYTLDRTWSFSDLAPSSPHTLGRYKGVSLTVELYLRNASQS